MSALVVTEVGKILNFKFQILEAKPQVLLEWWLWSLIGALLGEGGLGYSGFKFQTGMGLGIQISNSAGFRIQMSVEEVTFIWDSKGLVRQSVSNNHSPEIFP